MEKKKLIVAGHKAFELLTSIMRDKRGQLAGGFELFYILDVGVQESGFLPPDEIWIITGPQVVTKYPEHMNFDGLCDLVNAVTNRS